MPKVPFSQSVRSLLALSAVLAALLPLAGCGPMTSRSASVSTSGGTNSSTSGYTPAAIGGMVHGGQQPVIGATVQLFQAGTGGSGSAATPLLSPAVTTNAQGHFSITGKYTCTSSTSLVYLVATGGDPGSGTANSSIVMIGALGQCGSIGANTSVVLNEVTTAAAAFALSNFMSSASNVGYSGDQSAILAAFNAAQGYANSSTGSSSNNDILAVANLMAACVNGSSSTCGDIMGQTGGGSDILSSMLYMSRHSLSEFTSLFTKYIQPNSPFPGGSTSTGSTPSGCSNNPTMTTMPSFTVSTSGGVSTATIHGMAGATFYHTTDGSPATTASATTTSFSVQLDDVIEVMAAATCYYSVYYDATTDAPSVTDDKGKFSIASPKTGTSYFYTLDGSTPTTKSRSYTSTVEAGTEDTFSVIAKAPGLKPAYSSLNTTLPFISIDGTTVKLQDNTDASKDGTSELSYGLNGPGSTLLAYPAGGFTVALADVAYGCAKAAGRVLQCSMLDNSGVVTPTIATDGKLTFTKDLPEAQIFYTQNGTTPTLTSSQYSTSSSITLSMADVLAYGAKAPGRLWAIYNLPPLPAPAVTLTNGVATMTDDFAGATIYFTTDGTQPTINSYKYAPPSFTPALMDVLSARAKAPGYPYSNWYASLVPSATGIPGFSYSPSTGLATMSVEDDTAAKIFYTVDGSTPTLSSFAYTAPFTAKLADIYLMIAKSPGRPIGRASSKQTTSGYPQMTLLAGGMVSIADPNDGRKFFYVANPYGGNGAPTITSTPYTAPFRMYPYTTVTAIAKIPGYDASSPYPLSLQGDIETLGSCGVVANGLAADRIGNVYAACADSTTAENIYKFGPSGAKSDVLFSFTLTNASSTPLGITVTPGGTLYVPDPNAGGVHRYMNGTHTFVTTPGLHPDHVFTQQWEQVFVLDGSGGYQVINPGSTTAAALADGHAPTACAGGLLNNPYNGGVYCASTTAYLGASYMIDDDGHTVFTDKPTLAIPGLVGGLGLAVDGDMYLAIRSSSATQYSSLVTIHPRLSSSTSAASQLTLTSATTPATKIDGSALTTLTLNNPMGVTSDPTGNIYVGEGTGAIRRLREAQFAVQTNAPSIAFSGGSFQVSTTAADATLYYTLDGSIPTKGAWAYLADFGTSFVNAAKTPASSLNTVGFTMKVPTGGVIAATSGQTIRVIAVSDGKFDSDVASATAP